MFCTYGRYRIGDMRVICSIQDGEMCVLVIEIAARREVYSKPQSLVIPANAANNLP